MIMIALTVFFGIFIITAAIWGPLYFIRAARNQQQADPERQAADATPSQNGETIIRSDRATVGDHDAVPSRPRNTRFAGLRQRFRRLSVSLFHVRASPSEEDPQPIILEMVSQFDDIVARLAQHEPGELGGSDGEDHLAEFEVSHPTPNAEVNVHDISGLVELVAQRESSLVPVSLSQVEQLSMDQSQHDDEQQENAQSGPSRPEHGSASMAAITKCKTC